MELPRVASCGLKRESVSPDPMGGRHEAEKGKVTKDVKHVKREGAAGQGHSGEDARASTEIRVHGDLFETGASRVSSLCTTSCQCVGLMRVSVVCSIISIENAERTTESDFLCTCLI